MNRAEFDDRALRIIGAVEDRSPRLAGVYQVALRKLRTAAQDGCESARISVICHCMRELMNCLPAAMADNFVQREKLSSGSRRQAPETTHQPCLCRAPSL